MKVVTVATDLENDFLRRLLIPSCRAAGLDLIILHRSTRTFTPSDKRAFITEFLPRAVAADEIIMFTDAYDSLFVDGEQHVREAYARFPQPVVFSGELNSWPLGVVGLTLDDDPPVGRFPYLNSGGFIGPAGDILELYAKYPVPPSDQFGILERLRVHGYDTDERFGMSDQYHWTLVRLLEPGRIGIDHHATIFEYYGPSSAGLPREEILREVLEFRQHGRNAISYQRDRAQLQQRLDEPSRAAQLHFAGAITKAALLDLLAEDLLPSWLLDVIAPQPSDPRSVQVFEV